MTAPSHAVQTSAPSAVLQRRHMLVERLLVDVLGMEWATVHTEAECLVGAVTPRVEARITELLGDPGTCPHGNPIPGSINKPDLSTAIPLSEATAIVEVVRIDDSIEDDVVTMRLLENVGLIPGRWAEITQVTTAGVHVIGSRANAVIPLEAAMHTYVRPIDPTRD